MLNEPERDSLIQLLDETIQPACVQFSSQIGGEEPQTFHEDSRLGTRIAFPRAFRNKSGQHFTALLEAFDAESFVVKVTRLDQPEETRRLALVHYDALEDPASAEEAAERILEELTAAFEQLRAHISQENR